MVVFQGRVCQERDYRLRMKIDELGMTLRDCHERGFGNLHRSLGLRHAVATGDAVRCRRDLIRDRASRLLLSSRDYSFTLACNNSFFESSILGSRALSIPLSLWD